MENNTITQKLAKIAYFCFLRQFMWLRSKYVSHTIKKRLIAAKKRAMKEAVISKMPRYVVMCKDRFYVYNRGGMLALAKNYRKRTGLSTDWRKLYIFEARVATEQEKEQAKLQKEANG